MGPQNFKTVEEYEDWLRKTWPDHTEKDIKFLRWMWEKLRASHKKNGFAWSE